MNQHSESTSSQGTAGFIVRHLALLGIAIVVLGGLYLVSQSVTSVTSGAVLFILVHVLLAAGILFAGRAALRRFFRRMHGTSHTHDELETEGVTISWARFYDVFSRILLLGQQKKLIQSILDLTRIQPGEKVLDIGCGTGILAIAAKLNAQSSAQIHGRDAAPEMIERARQKAIDANADVDFQTGLAEAIQFPDGSFDLAMNSLMVHHLPGDLKTRAFGEMYRVLKPGGRLLIVDFEPPTNSVYKTILGLIVGRPMTGIDNSANLPLLREAGFTNVKMGPTGSRMSTYIAGVKPS